MTFRIRIQVGNRYHNLNVERLSLTRELERFIVRGRDRSIMLQSNRPLLRAKGLDKFPPAWKVLEGSMHNAGALEKIIAAIMEQLEGKAQG